MGLSLYLTDDEADHLRRIRASGAPGDLGAAAALSAVVIAFRALDRQDEARTGGRHLSCCGHVAPEHYAACTSAASDHDDDGPTRGPGPIRDPFCAACHGLKYEHTCRR